MINRLLQSKLADAAIQDSGRQVLYAGALPTPALAFYAAQILTCETLMELL
jgi:phosphomannomutase